MLLKILVLRFQRTELLMRVQDGLLEAPNCPVLDQ